MTATSTVSSPGFVVLYRWRLHPGTEDSFISAWSRVSELMLTERGSLGSRLHRGSDGLWYSYAQWPSSQARDNAFALGSADTNASGQMARAVVERLPDIVLEPVADYILPSVTGGA